jgi:hypothetical protein
MPMVQRKDFTSNQKTQNKKQPTSSLVLGEGESGLPQAVRSITGGAATARERNRRQGCACTLIGPRRGPTSPEIADFASCRREFFEKCIDLFKGLPTDDTLRHFFQNLNPRPFRARFAQWASSMVHDGKQGKVVSIDGKRVRKAGEMNGGNPIHIVNTWLAEKEMTIEQLNNDGIDHGKKRVSLKCRMPRAVHDKEYRESLPARL